MRHQGLESSSIRKLVGEREKIDAAEGLTKALVLGVDKLLTGKFEKSRRLSFGELQSIFNRADEVFRQKTAAVASSLHHTPGTRLMPKRFGAESLYLGLRRMSKPPLGFQDVYQLFAFRLVGTSKFVRIEVDYLPLAFQYHAAERLLERMRSTDTAFLDVAKSLAEWCVVIKKAQYAATSSMLGLLNIPALDERGALLGEYVGQAAEPGICIEHDEFGSAEWKTTSKRHTLFLVSTFVDRFHLRPVQLHAMHLLTEWKERHAQDYGYVRSSIIWPGTTENPHVACLMKDAEDDLNAILRNPEFIRGMDPNKETNRTIPGDFELPLGRWAHDACRREAVAPVDTDDEKPPEMFEGLLRRRRPQASLKE